MVEFGEFLDDIGTQVMFRQSFSIKVDRFVRRKYNGCAEFQDPLVRKSLDDAFNTDAIQITRGNANDRFVECWNHNHLNEPVKILLLGTNVYLKKIPRPAFSQG